MATCQYLAAPPNSVILKLTKGGINVTDAVLNDTRLSYYNGNSKTYVTDFMISSDVSNRNKGLIASRNIGVLSADKNIKTYYLEYSNGWTTDTLFVDYLPYSPATNCVYVLQSVTKRPGSRN